MKRSYKWLLVVVVIIVLLICGFIGFYLLDNTGVLTGDSITDIKSNTWDISIKNDEPVIDGDGSITSTVIQNNNININGELTNSSDKITYNLEIKNNGSIDAYLYSIINSGNDDITIKYLNDDEELESGFILKSGETLQIKLLIQTNKDESLKFNLNSQLVFNQYIDK